MELWHGLQAGWFSVSPRKCAWLEQWDAWMVCRPCTEDPAVLKIPFNVLAATHPALSQNQSCDSCVVAVSRRLMLPKHMVWPGLPLMPSCWAVQGIVQSFGKKTPELQPQPHAGVLAGHLAATHCLDLAADVRAGSAGSHGNN